MKPCIAAFWLLLLTCPAALWAQKVEGNGEVVTTTRDVEDFEGIEINGALEVELTQGQGYRLQVITDRNLQDLIQAEVVEGVLVLETDRRIGDATQLKLLIGSDAFASIEVSGAVKMSSTTPLYGENLRMDLSGASAINLALAYERVQTDISGAGSLKLKGKTRMVEHEISGAGRISAFALRAESVAVDISGIGLAQVHASENLVARISGLGSITYSGSPKVSKDISGLGSLARK